jgi:hypothetical protein
MVRELVINSPTMSCCGKPKAECLCSVRNADGSTSLAEAQAASTEAAHTSIKQLNDSYEHELLEEADGLAVRALKASKAGDSEKAAALHGKAAEVHDKIALDARRVDEPRFADRHLGAAEKHRVAKSKHETLSGEKTMVENSDDILESPVINFGRNAELAYNAGTISSFDRTATTVSRGAGQRTDGEYDTISRKEATATDGEDIMDWESTLAARLGLSQEESVASDEYVSSETARRLNPGGTASKNLPFGTNNTLVANIGPELAVYLGNDALEMPILTFARR